MKTTPLEAAIGLKRTKGGGDDKQLAYLTSRENLKRIGIALLLISSFVLIYGVVLKQDLSFAQGASSALRKQAIREKQVSRLQVPSVASVDSVLDPYNV
jgi:hypothetical protein